MIVNLFYDASSITPRPTQGKM